MKTIDFVPATIPSNSAAPEATIKKLECGQIQVAVVHNDVLTPHSYASSMAKAKYLRQRGIRAAYRNNYTAPRKGGQPYSYGQTILIARGQRIPEGFTLATV